MVEKQGENKKRGRSSSSSSSSSSGSSSSGSSSSGSRSSSSSSSSRSRSRSPRRRDTRPARGGRSRSRSPIRRGSPPRGARADRGGNDRSRQSRPTPSPPRRRRISPSPPRRDRRDRSVSGPRRRSSPRRSPVARSASPIKRVVIKNLSKNVLRSHLEEIFSIYGAIKNVDLPPDRYHNHLHRGYGYVDYETVDDAEKSIKHMDGGQIDGLIVQVEMTVGRQVPHPHRRVSPFRRRVSPSLRDRKSPIRRPGNQFRARSPPRRRSPIGGRGSGANNMPLGPSRFRRGSRSRSPLGRRSRS
uniref:RRM domain-containing protein n=1 Tax=Caenorhabditis tropicalis TaxID=1561998 RepID=A0A1I7UJQ9_9PELO